MKLEFKKITKKKDLLRSYDPMPSALTENRDGWLANAHIYNSSAMGGGSLSGFEIADVIEKGFTISRDRLKDYLEAVNQDRVFWWISHWLKQQDSRSKLGSLKEEHICYMHFLLMEGIDSEHAGKYREVPAETKGFRISVPEPEKVPELMAEFVEWLRRDQISHPVYMAAQAHYKLLKIQPFVSGNGLLARLFMNLILLSSGYPITYFHEEERARYFEGLEKADVGDQEDYLALVCEAVDRSLEHYLEGVRRSRMA